MIDYSISILENVSVHHVGNKNNEEEILLSKSGLNISDEHLRQLLMKYFVSSFTSDEFYSFTSADDDHKLNPLYNYASQMFNSRSNFHNISIEISKLLYEQSVHPQIKPGDLFVAYFKDLLIDDEIADAVGIFKCENRHIFLKLGADGSNFILNIDEGINIDKLDKGCIIFNTEKQNGYKIGIVDKSSKSSEAQFWKDNFLVLKPCNDTYHHTKNFLSIAKNYAAEQYPEDFNVNKTDQIEIMNRSVDYFKTHENFNKEDFERNVFRDPGVIRSFRKYDEDYRSANEIDFEDSFEISPNAVKRQAKIFKSVLKLDKNFHIYIHGSRELIEQGVDRDGRKYYKFYFEEEY